ncbi:MAG: endonuclease domain-containing protein [Bacteroidales bacterium]|jgi:very-short-patch-repair endonuclease
MAYLGRSITREMYFGAKPDLFRMADRMRKNPTEAEKILWRHIKKFRSEGYVFRRQHPIDFYIADLYCHRLKLVIEVDGEIHETEEAREHDDGRTGHLEQFGIKIIRFTNEEVLSNKELVIRQIRKYLYEPASPALLGAGDGRG